MKFIIVFVALFAVALAAPPKKDEVQIVKSSSDVGPESFNFEFETDDNTKVESSGKLKNVGTEEEAIVVRGSYSFVADDGQTYTVNYVADENGFQPQGAHLPVAPTV